MVVLAWLIKTAYGPATGSQRLRFLVATVLYRCIGLRRATINDNLQDLKTGQPVGATPWKVVVALIIGARRVGGMALIPADGTFQGRRAQRANALAALQAALMSALAGREYLVAR